MCILKEDGDLRDVSGYDTFRPVALSWDASTLQKTFGNVWGTLLVVTAGSGRFHPGSAVDGPCRGDWGQGGPWRLLPQSGQERMRTWPKGGTESTSSVKPFLVTCPPSGLCSCPCSQTVLKHSYRQSWGKNEHRFLNSSPELFLQH